MTEEEKAKLKAEDKRDILILAEITAIYSMIRDKIQKEAMRVSGLAGDNTSWFKERNRSKRFAKKVNEELRPLYLKKDVFSKTVYNQEYSTAYYTAKFGVENKGLRAGYKFKLPKYTNKQNEQAFNYALSKLADNAKMQTGRSIDIQQLYTTIVSGVEQGSSLPNINKQLDINLGYRDAKTGKWISKPELRKGQQYKTRRILRTEINRMRSIAETDQWLNQQDIVPSKLQWLSVLDSRTRPQSAQMDGQIANKKAEFRYPNDVVAQQGQSGVAGYEVNDRCSTIPLDEDFPPESRIQRDKDGNNKILPYENFKSYADNQGLKTNIYGQVLFPK